MAKSGIYTRTGDSGKTSLVGGVRVSKTAQRIESYGTVDELNSFIGLLQEELEEQEDLNFLNKVQHRLFNIGSYLATDKSLTTFVIQSGISDAVISEIEQEIDRLDMTLPPMKGFVLPGGSKGASLAHVCRTICRRAEREIYRLAEETEVESPLLVFINRLSDYFFVLARKECIKERGEEIIWNNSCKS